MRASELIQELQKNIKKYGDLEVFSNDSDGWIIEGVSMKEVPHWPKGGIVSQGTKKAFVIDMY